ncbi:hypothetical protein NPIL_478081 [Nephila pilipes]|uniref:Uncharacterized protein n=1 Tax=Nephila pilipes TaxID=299642 RepID=A0A8X6PXK6_NEPPI|nr:hypothetical protein NPIL_478081 [Nephila pilipes]
MTDKDWIRVQVGFGISERGMEWEKGRREKADRKPCSGGSDVEGELTITRVGQFSEGTMHILGNNVIVLVPV